MTLKHPLALAAALLCGAGFLWHSQAQSGPGTGPGSGKPEDVAPVPKKGGGGYDYKLVVQPLPGGMAGLIASEADVLNQYPQWEIVDVKLVENYEMAKPPRPNGALSGQPGTHPAMAYTIRKRR